MPDSLETNTTRPHCLCSSIRLRLLVLQHPLEIMPRQANRAHHVDLEHPHPVAVLDLEEGFRLVKSEIVDQDIDLWKLRHESGATFGAGELENGSMQFGRRRRLPDLHHGLRDGGIVS